MAAHSSPIEERWSPDGVVLEVRPAAWRHEALMWLALALLLGAIAFYTAFFALLPVEGAVGPWAIAFYALLGLPLPGMPLIVLAATRVVRWLDEPTRVALGSDRLAIDGQVFRRLEVRRVELTEQRIAVTRIDGTTWRSPYLSGLDTPRLQQLLGGFGCELEDALDEADRAEDVRRALAPLLRGVSRPLDD